MTPREQPRPTIRDATAADLPAIVRLLAADPLGALREDTRHDAMAAYEHAFEAIAADRHHHVMVADAEHEVIGVLQLSFLPHLTYGGGWRGQVEGVRVAERYRSSGLGEGLLRAAIDRARSFGCHLVQLTTDRRRPEALRFYRSLGFEASHEGLKLHFDRASDED